MGLQLRSLSREWYVAMHYMMDMKPVTYTKSALKTLRRMPANVAKLIMAKVGQYAADPAPPRSRIMLRAREGGMAFG